MRENPTPNEDPKNLIYAGDNFIRNNGDALELSKTEVFAWDAQSRGSEVHAQANPSQVEMMQRQFESKKGELKQTQRDAILEAYGGAQHLDTPDERLLHGQTEAYVEYAADGRVIKGAPKAIAKSKYQEDVFLNNHTAIWGSFFDTRSFRWGFSDDHSLIKVGRETSRSYIRPPPPYTHTSSRCFAFTRRSHNPTVRRSPDHWDRGRTQLARPVASPTTRVQLVSRAWPLKRGRCWWRIQSASESTKERFSPSARRSMARRSPILRCAVPGLCCALWPNCAIGRCGCGVVWRESFKCSHI